MSNLYDYGKQAGQWTQHKGQNVHGVTAPDDGSVMDPAVEWDNPHDKESVGVEAEPYVASIEPIPVRVVDPVDRSRNTRTKFRTYRTTVRPGGTVAAPTGSCQQIAGQQDNRTYLRARPLTLTNAVTFSEEPNSVPGQGWEVSAAGGAEPMFETRSQDAVYAVGHHATDHTTIEVYIEYTVVE